MRRIPLVLIGVVVVAMAALAVNASAASPEFVMTQANGYTLNQYDGNFDKESCEQNCRSLYGVDPYWRGGRTGDRGRYYVYAQCVQDCNTRFWKEFDRKTRDLDDD
jgi:predicted lipoprotein with Yx(FWY)xxD motif